MVTRYGILLAAVLLAGCTVGLAPAGSVGPLAARAGMVPATPTASATRLLLVGALDRMVPVLDEAPASAPLADVLARLADELAMGPSDPAARARDAQGEAPNPADRDAIRPGLDLAGAAGGKP